MSTTLTEAPDVTPTQQALYEMLTENTGRHMLDSGGAYGRNWERNQRFTIQDFLDREPSTLSGRWGLEITHDLFHWLDDRVEYEEEIDALFERWATTGDREHEPWLVCAERFLHEVLGEVYGIYGEGDPITVNTYNGEDLLSQTIQYVYFEVPETIYLTPSHDGFIYSSLSLDEDEPREGVIELDSDAYVLLQIHGGCDVRGGYTRPRVFRVMEEMAILDNAHAGVGCTECPATWYTDDGYHLYGHNGETDLDDLDFFEKDPSSRSWARAALLRVLHEMGEDPEDWGIEPSIPVDEDGTVYCPVSGHPMTAMAW